MRAVPGHQRPASSAMVKGRRNYDRTVHNWPTLHVNGVRNRFITNCTERIGMAGKYFCMAHCTPSDERWRFNPRLDGFGPIHRITQPCESNKTAFCRDGTFL